MELGNSLDLVLQFLLLRPLVTHLICNPSIMLWVEKLIRLRVTTLNLFTWHLWHVKYCNVVNLSLIYCCIWCVFFFNVSSSLNFGISIWSIHCYITNHIILYHAILLYMLYVSSSSGSQYFLPLIILRHKFLLLVTLYTSASRSLYIL